MTTLSELLTSHPDLPVEVCCDRCKWRFRISTLWRGPASFDGDWIRLDTGRHSRVSRWLRLDEQGSGTGPDGRMLECFQGLCPENKRTPHPAPTG